MSEETPSVIDAPPWYSHVNYRIRSFIRYTLRDWIAQRAINLVVWLNRDSNYISHVRREVPGWFSESGPNRWIADGTVELLAVLSHQGHSGGSIHFAIQFFKAMALFEPWGPLTGEESEWGEPYGEDGTRQNLRCSHVFMGRDGKAYDINGRIFREPNGNCYGSRESKVPVEFPYMPKTVYVGVEE